MTGAATQRLPAKSVSPFKRITDFGDLVQLFSRWEGSFEQLSCGRFESKFLVASGQQIHAFFATANQSMRVRGREGSGVYTFTLVLPSSAGCDWQHKRLDPGCLVVRSGDVEADHRTSRQPSNLSFSVGEETLRTAWRAVHQTEPKPTGWMALSPPPEAYAVLEDRLRRFVLTNANRPATGQQDAHLLEQECLRAAVEAAFPAAISGRMDLPLAARGNLVRRAEELMRARLRTPTGEIDLCTELGVSGRTLRLAFRERFAMGPMAYYQTIRLNAARAVLQTANAEEVSVAEVARRFGFSHLGKFAGYYGRLFGERPSFTLTRNKSSQGTVGQMCF